MQKAATVGSAAGDLPGAAVVGDPLCVDLASIPQSWLVAALAVVGTAGAAQGARGAIVRWARRRRIHGRLERAGDAEREAAEYVQDAGFSVVGAQVASTYELLVDGAPTTITVRADLLVERRARRWVVEVKSGRAAPRVENPATRRQLLEYRVAFDVDGVLLYDAEARRLREIRFPGEPAQRERGTSGWLVLVGALVVVAVAVAAAWASGRW